MSGAKKRPREDPPAPPLAALRLQSAFRGFRVRAEGLSRRRREAAAAAREAAAARAEAAVSARLRTAEYRQVARYCKDASPRQLAAVDESLEHLVGLDAVKEYCGALRQDCLARAALGDAPLVRNVLISGNLGVGKKLAAETICKLLRALGAAKGMVPTQTTLEHLALDVRRDVSCVVVEGLTAIEANKGKVDAVLSNFPGHAFVFLGPTTAVEALHGAVPYFRKAEPAWLQLPNYSPMQLAAIAHAQLAEAGYGLADGLAACDLQATLCSVWSRDVLAMRNAHLAHELLQRSISNRNRRLPLPRLLAAPLTLTAADLGLEQRGLSSLLAERDAVDAEVASLVGMAPLKAFLAELRAKVGYVARGGDPRLLESCLNVVLTGNPGAGKTTAARLLFRSLRAHGLLRKNVFVERNALELKGTHIGWTCPQVKEMVQAALGGCLFLDEAYALSGGGRDGDRGDSFSDEALRTLLTETENNRSSLCVVLAGYRQGMAHLMRSDPGLVRRFPTTIDLHDYSPAELAAIARQTAASRFGLAFEDGLEQALASHIRTAHASEIHQHNASLAVSLVEAAMNRLAARLTSEGPAAAGSSACGGADAADAAATTLVPSDFAIVSRAAAASSRGAVVGRIAALPSQLAAAAEHLSGLSDRLCYVARGGPAAALAGATRLVLCGEAGTDAPLVASLLHQLLASHGVVTGDLVRRSALPLLSHSAHEAAQRLEDILGGAARGTLHLDDAGALAASPAAARALGAALAELPDTSAVVLSGSPREVAALLSAAPDLRRLFGPPVALRDLTAYEVASGVASRLASGFDARLAPGLLAELEEHVCALLRPHRAEQASPSLDGPAAGAAEQARNGALVERLVQAAVGRMASRAAKVASRFGEPAAAAAAKEICAEDFALPPPSSESPASVVPAPAGERLYSNGKGVGQ